MGEKQVKQIARRPIRSFEARRKQQTQERDDGVVVQLLSPYLCTDEISDDVVGQLGPPQFNLFPKVGRQAHGCVESGLDVLLDRNEIKGQLSEHLQVVCGEPKK